MLNARLWLSLVVAGALSAAAPHASAAGFGASGSAAVLGQPLAFNVVFRADAGDPLTSDCVSAEVMLGDRRLSASDVRTSVDMHNSDIARIRVQTTGPVDEPVVGVMLTVGCNAKQTRRFVLFADPPPVVAQGATPAALAALSLPLVDAEALAAPAAAGPAPVRQAGSVPAAATAAAAAAPAPVAAGPRAAALQPRTALARSNASATPPRARTPRSERRPGGVDRNAPAVPRASAAAPVAAAAAPPAGPRLQLDFAAPAAPDLIDAALAAVAEAASATRAANAAASAASARIAALERDVERLRNDARATRDAAAGWQSRLAQAESSERWLWPLILLTLGLAALASWLSWRLSVVQRQRQLPWQQAAAEIEADEAIEAASSAPMPFVIGSGPASARHRGTPAWPPPAALETLPPDEDERDTVALQQARKPSLFLPVAVGADDPAIGDARTEPLSLAARTDGDAAVAPLAALRPESEAERTQPYVPPWTNDDPAPRDVSIEELIDLEQQAEFFVVLGQDEAAVDLLVDHLRQSGGGSPLPYLKLLEIYHRRGDREEYERTRTRFNHRFNAYAPDWEVGPNSGQALEDYPGIVPRLQQCWSQPLDAMAELEALLFRKSRGELFDLPAYREVLFLYSLARDLLDREAADTGSVDLLLPMTDGSRDGSTQAAPHPVFGPIDGSDPDDDRDDSVTLPVDLDLSNEQTRPASIFDALHDTLKRK